MGLLRHKGVVLFHAVYARPGMYTHPAYRVVVRHCGIAAAVFYKQSTGHHIIILLVFAKPSQACVSYLGNCCVPCTNLR